MDQWRKRISRIATNFEVAHKAELKTAEKQTLDSKAKQVGSPTSLPDSLYRFQALIQLLKYVYQFVMHDSLTWYAVCCVSFT